jgi:hypothetical protein
MLRLQLTASIFAAVAIGFMLGWANGTVHDFGAGKVGESQFETAVTINHLFGIPLRFFLVVVAVLAGGFSSSGNADGSTPTWVICLASAIWGVMIFVGLLVATCLWRWLVQPSNE